MKSDVKYIGFSGKAEAGKSYHAKILMEKLNEMGYCAVVTPLAKKLKEQARILGWDGEKDEKGRTLLQTLSDPIKEYHGRDCYARWAIDDAFEDCTLTKPELPDSKYVMICDDVRMVDEINHLKNYEGLIVRVERPNYKSSLNEEQLKDKTETQLDNYEFDLVVENMGNYESAADNCELIIDKFLKTISL